MKTIIAATDFSPVSLNAVNYAADMACAIDASLSLFYACPLPIGFAEVPIPAETYQKLIDDAEESMNKLQERITSYTVGKIQITRHVANGNVVPQLKEYCDSMHPYMVVIGPRGAGAVETFLFGSTTTAAMKHLPYPLIVVPPDAKFQAIRKIGLACDLKKVDETL
ncbi:MAG: universal stress protein, partial [Chitinophagaceae bacterium]